MSQIMELEVIAQCEINLGNIKPNIELIENKFKSNDDELLDNVNICINIFGNNFFMKQLYSKHFS